MRRNITPASPKMKNNALNRPLSAFSLNSYY